MSLRRLATTLALGQLVLLALSAAPAAASLDAFYSDAGHLRLSVDGVGTNDPSGVVQADKAGGATVKKAFLFAASTGLSNFNPPDGEVTIDGTPVNWDAAHTVASSIGSYNVAADVTSVVKPKIDAAPSGHVDFTITEQDTGQMDGEILAVVLDDPSVKTNTVYLMYGAQNTGGDHFAIGLTDALKPSAAVTMGLGISYGYQPAGQYSQVDVNGQRLTTSAGGQDDGQGTNGALLTVGGLDDSTANPTDPSALDGCPEAPRCDDELYDLKPFVAGGATSIGVDTVNPSHDDNIFFASLAVGSATAVVGEGLALSPTGTRTEVNNSHSLTAFAQDKDGKPLAGTPITLKATSGPSAGLTLTTTTDSNGEASFSYQSSAAGTDTLEASFTDGEGAVHTSHEVTHEWTPQIEGTFGGEWPYNGSSLQLYYDYAGGHRYLGNAFQGAKNWNDAGTKVHIDAWPGVPYAIHIPFVDVNLRDEWWGMTVFQDDCLTCGYTRNTIELNQRTLDPEGDAQRTKVATHELGHALGLQHAKGIVSSSVPSVMWQGSLGHQVTSTPQPFDISRVNGMYP
jgi:hypothetical protein